MNNFNHSESYNDLQQEILRLITGLIEVKSAVFYFVDKSKSYKSLGSINFSQDCSYTYRKYFLSLDPLSLAAHKSTGFSVIDMDAIASSQLIANSIYFKDFLLPRDYRYVVDIVFGYEGKVAAIIKLFRSESQGPFLESDLSQLSQLQGFIEFVLSKLVVKKRIDNKSAMEDQYKLTKRELDVVELLVTGATNKDISNELLIGLSTVKTHLQNVFSKVGVDTRGELISKFFSERKSVNAF